MIYYRSIMKISRFAICSCLCMLIVLHGTGQPIETLQKRFVDFAEKRVAEKIYVQTDKQFFLAGEILWLKLYVLNAANHLPLAMSKLAYVEILDKNNRPVAQAKIQLKDAQGNGSIFLPVQLTSGNYQLRAYTNWMKNSGADFYFSKPITIVNTQRQGEWAAGEKKQDYDLQFFPEGGNLVTGINSKLGFRLTDNYGKGQAFEGRVINAANETVANFNPGHAGIGHFNFTPVANQSYKAIVKLTDGSILEKPLPVAQTSGYVISVIGDPSSVINIKVQTNISAANEVYLLAHTRQHFKFIRRLTIINGTGNISVNREDIGDGITHFTVFNANGQPLAERLFFQFPKQQLTIHSKPGNESYTGRKPVSLELKTSVNGIPADAELSISVFRIDSLQALPVNDIRSYFWLTSDLRGNIEAPSYYFNLPEKEAALAIDNLMLTHGWRRFTWKEVEAAVKPAMRFPPELNGHLVTTRLLNTVSAEPVTNVEAFMSIPGPEIAFSTATSNEEGKAVFEIKDFYGPAEMILQAKQDKDSSFRVEIENPFSTSFSGDKIPDYSFPINTPNTLLDHHIAQQVRTTYTGLQLKQLIAADVDTTGFYGKAETTYMLDDFTRFRTMEEVLREYVKLVFVRKRGNNFHLTVYDPIAKKALENDPLVLIDGVPIFDQNKLMSIDPLQIRKLEVLYSRYFYGNAIFDGILHWFTYDNNIAHYELDSRVTVTSYEGLQLQREFFSPLYDTQEKISSSVPDFRNVLLWQPEISFKANQDKKIHFYTSDLPGRYAIIVEGMTANGVCGSTTQFIEVK